MTYLDIIRQTLERLGVTDEPPEEFLYFISGNHYHRRLCCIASPVDIFPIEVNVHEIIKGSHLYQEGIQFWGCIHIHQEFKPPKGYNNIKLWAYLSSDGVAILHAKYGRPQNLGNWLPLIMRPVRNQKVHITL
jgi:hypothetical protein